MHRTMRWGAVAMAALTVTGVVGLDAVSSAQAAQTLTYYAFGTNNGGLDMNNNVVDPGFFAAAGSNPVVLSQGDQTVVNDQLTGTHKSGEGYAIVGYDSGVCTVTRVPDPKATSGAQKGPRTLEDCNVTAVVKAGSLVAEGVITNQLDPTLSANLAIIGGTGAYAGASGTVTVSFGKTYNTYAIDLK